MNRFKKIIGAVASAAAILSLALFIYPHTMAATDPIIISPQHMYILADTGTSISLSSIQATMDGKTYVTGDVLTWTPADTGLTVSGGTMKATTDGVHKVNISVATVNADIYVVTKQASATEYVLYEQNFDNVANGSLPDGWALCDHVDGNTAGVQDGKLVIDSTPKGGITSVRMPSFLNVFDNYTAEAEFCLAKVNDPTRYCSLVYRMQVDETKNPATYVPSCLMTVRQHKDGDSVEMTGRPTTTSWDQADVNKQDHHMTLDTSTFYKDKVVLNGNNVKEYFNGTKYIDYDGLANYPIGGTGLLSGGSQSIWDNVKISIQPENLTTGTTAPTTLTKTEPSASTTGTSTTKSTTVNSTTETSATESTTVTSATETSATESTTVTSTTEPSATESTTVSSATEPTATTVTTATTTAIVPTASETSADTTTEAAPETTTEPTTSQQSPKTGSAALPGGLLVLIAASSAAVYFNRKK